MKYFSLLLLPLLFINTNTAMAAERISVTVNGNPVNFNTEPRIINDRTLIQIRPVVEAFGCSVVWDDATKTSYINQPGYPLNKTATLGNDINVYVNNNRIVFPDQKPVNVDGFVMIPSRTVVEALGGAVVWDNRSKTQIISTDKAKIDTYVNAIKSDNIISVDFIEGGGSSGIGDIIIKYTDKNGNENVFSPKGTLTYGGYLFEDINSDGIREIVNFENILYDMWFSNAVSSSAAFPVIYRIDTDNNNLVDISKNNFNWYNNTFLPELKEKISTTTDDEYRHAYITLYILVDEFVKGNLPDIYKDPSTKYQSAGGRATDTMENAEKYYKILTNN